MQENGYICEWCVILYFDSVHVIINLSETTVVPAEMSINLAQEVWKHVI